MTKEEMQRVQKYLRAKLGNPDVEVRDGEGKDAPCQLYAGGEFLGVIYRDVDDGEVTYDVNISILEMDVLEE